jgi:hypothetical protein
LITKSDSDSSSDAQSKSDSDSSSNAQLQLIIVGHTQFNISANISNPVYPTTYIRDVYSWTPSEPADKRINAFDGGFPAGSTEAPLNWCEIRDVHMHNGKLYVTGNMGCTPHNQPNTQVRGLARYRPGNSDGDGDGDGDGSGSWDNLLGGVSNSTRCDVNRLAFDDTSASAPRMFVATWDSSYPMSLQQPSSSSSSSLSLSSQQHPHGRRISISHVAQYSDTRGWNSVGGEPLQRTPLDMLLVDDQTLYLALIGDQRGGMLPRPQSTHAGVVSIDVTANGGAGAAVFTVLPGFEPQEYVLTNQVCMKDFRTGKWFVIDDAPPCGICDYDGIILRNQNCTKMWTDPTQVSMLQHMSRHTLLVMSGTWKSVPTAHPHDTVTAFDTTTQKFVDMNYTASGMEPLSGCSVCVPCAVVDVSAGSGGVNGATQSQQAIVCSDQTRSAVWLGGERRWVPLPVFDAFPVGGSRNKLVVLKSLDALNTVYAFTHTYVLELDMSVVDDWAWKLIPFDFQPVEFIHGFLPIVAGSIGKRN